MTEKSDALKFLEDAYSLKEPSDSVRYYDTFASTYDADFATGLGYTYPLAVAQFFRESCSPEDYPIADIGCGTGLVAQALSVEAGLIDGMDISGKMLDLARQKNLYRALYQVDLTASLETISNRYGAVLSAGTFTHGHLGTETLVALLGIARQGALFVIGINREHFKSCCFAEVLIALEKDGSVHGVTTRDVAIYQKSGHRHAQDQACIVSFRKS